MQQQEELVHNPVLLAFAEAMGYKVGKTFEIPLPTDPNLERLTIL